MGKLNESLVCARTKSTSIENVRRLNCWGCDLDDISLIEDMPNIEVLSLSVNSITTLKHLRNCRHLRELYIRGNCIYDLREVEHLKNLTKLRVLWLDENPCSQLSGYRNFVLRTLPFLTNLDNRPVIQNELNESSFQRTSSPLTMGQRKCFEEANGLTCKLSLSPMQTERQSEEMTERKKQQQCRNTNSAANDFGYESSNSENSTQSFQGQEVCRGNAYNEYGTIAPHLIGNIPPKVTSCYSTSATVVRKQQSCGNVLKAVLTLLDELDEQQLRIVAQEITHRLQNS